MKRTLIPLLLLISACTTPSARLPASQPIHSCLLRLPGGLIYQGLGYNQEQAQKSVWNYCYNDDPKGACSGRIYCKLTNPLVETMECRCDAVPEQWARSETEAATIQALLYQVYYRGLPVEACERSVRCILVTEGAQQH